MSFNVKIYWRLDDDEECEECGNLIDKCACEDQDEEILPQIQLTEDLIPGLVASLQSKDKADIDLAQQIINNRDKSTTSQDVFDKLLNGMLNSDTCLTKVKIKELWIIKVNDIWVKPSNSGNGFYKSETGCKKALNTMLSQVSYGNSPYYTHPLTQTIKNNIPIGRYLDPKYKKSGKYLRGGDALIKFFYDNNKVEFIKIDL